MVLYFMPYIHYPNMYLTLISCIELGRYVEKNKAMKKLRHSWHIDTFTALCATETFSNTISNTFRCWTSPKSLSITLEPRRLGKTHDTNADPAKEESKIPFFKIFYIIIIFFYFTILYWFCHASTMCVCIHVSHPELPSHFPPHTIPLGHPSAPAPSFLYPASNLDWWFISYKMLYMF